MSFNALLIKINAYEIPLCLYTSACVRMLDWFNHHGHICIVFELLGLSTYDLLQKNSFQPFPVENIRYMAYQIIKTVRCKFSSITNICICCVDGSLW